MTVTIKHMFFKAAKSDLEQKYRSRIAYQVIQKF